MPRPTLVRRDTIILTESALIVAGADTHLDTIHVAAITTTGATLGDKEFPTTGAGYAAAIAFLMTLGHIVRIGGVKLGGRGRGKQGVRTLPKPNLKAQVIAAHKAARRM